MSEIKNHNKAYWTCQILGWGIYGLLNTVFLSAFQTITAQNLGITVFGSAQLLLWTHPAQNHIQKAALGHTAFVETIYQSIDSRSGHCDYQPEYSDLWLSLYRRDAYDLNNSVGNCMVMQILNTNFILWIWSLLYVIFHMFDITKRGGTRKMGIANSG